MAAGGNAMSAIIIEDGSAGGCGGDVSTFAGGKGGDIGGGEDSSTALPLPLSTFGSCSSTSVPSVGVSDSAVELIDPVALRCISLSLCEMRSETVPDRCGVRASRGARRGDVV